MDTYAESKRLLELNGYTISPNAMTLDQFHFEDESIMGMVWVVAAPLEIVENWQKVQDRFLKDHALQLRRAADKSWNIYVVLLAEGPPSPEERLKLAQIEEDFKSTRKIAQADLKTRSDLQRALYPLLPIQNFVPPDAQSQTRSVLDSKIKQARLDSSARLLLEVDLTEETLNSFIAAHENQKD